MVEETAKSISLVQDDLYSGDESLDGIEKNVWGGACWTCAAFGVSHTYPGEKHNSSFLFFFFYPTHKTCK